MDAMGRVQTSWRQSRSRPMGKLRVHASGRVSLVVGDIVMDVSEGVPPRHVQEVMVADARGAAGERTFASMGPLAAKLVCTPDLEAMLPQWTTRQRQHQPSAEGAGREDRREAVDDGAKEDGEVQEQEGAQEEDGGRGTGTGGDGEVELQEGGAAAADRDEEEEVEEVETSWPRTTQEEGRAGKKRRRSVRKKT